MLSITGADNYTNIQELKFLQEQFSMLEFGLLYFLEKEGTPRNPDYAWRQEFFKNIPASQSSLHLCGEEVFRLILDDKFKKSATYQEFIKVGRIQININARKDIFTHEEIHKIYMKLIKSDFKIIIQYNERSKDWILPFLENNPGYIKSIDMLLDSSLGKGIIQTNFSLPKELEEYSFKYGFAGGLTVENIQTVQHEVLKNNVDYWLDLESGARTDNIFDLEKSKNIAEIVFNT